MPGRLTSQMLRRSVTKRGLVHLERILWVGGLSLLAVCVIAASGILIARRAAARVVAGIGSAQASAETVPVRSGEIAQSAAPAVVGRVEIPAIGMLTPLLAGDDSMSLTQGAGHIPGTAYPGGLGTVGIAGHRDTHFRLLREVKPGMDVRLIDQTGTYHYRVISSEIVTPSQVSVLDIVSQPGLVLVTCFPFNYLGKAPKRFIVHAALVSAAPDAAAIR